MAECKYPRIGAVTAIVPPKGRCVVCGAKATHEAAIQYTYMRGDDSLFRVCREHRTATVDALHATVKEGDRG